MKKIISVVLLLSVCLSSLLLFSSCGKKKSDDNAVNLFSEEGLLCVGRGDKYGYMDKKGKEVIPCKYADAEAFENGYAVVQETEDGPYYYIKPNGSRLMETPFYRAQNFDSQGRAVVKRSEKGKAELIDKSGKVYLTAKSIFSSDIGLYLYKDDADLWGVANKSGKTLLTPSYDDLDFVYDLKEDGKNATETVNKDRLIATRKLSSGSAYYLIDLDGEEYYSVTGQYSRIYPYIVDGNVLAYKDGEETGTAYVISKSGKAVATVENVSSVFGLCKYGLLLKIGEDVYKMIDYKGKALVENIKATGFTPYDLDWNGDLLAYLKLNEAGDRKYGILNAKNGETVIPVEYDDLESADGNDLFLAKKGDDYLVLNRKGKTVFTKTCDNLASLGNPNSPYYVAVYNQEDASSYELLDTKGQTVKTFGTVYSRIVNYYDDGFLLCREKESGNYVFLNKKLEPLGSAIYDEIVR